MSRPSFDDDELRARCRKGTFKAVEPGWEPYLRQVRGPEGETLLHLAQGPGTVRVLLAAGLDPNARDRNGRTPLMWNHGAEDNRLLLASGADVHLVDSQGEGALAHQAGTLVGAVGYTRPDFAALDVLVAAGATPPTRDQAHEWIAQARSQVTSAGENGDCLEFARWVLRVIGSSAETEPVYVVKPRVPKTLLPPEPTLAELAEFADSDDEATREAVYQHPQRPVERIALLERAGAYPEPAVRPGETWFDWSGGKVGGTPAVTTRPAIALDPNLPFADFAFLLERGEFARTLVARHPATPPAVLGRLVRDDPSTAVRIAAAGNPGLPTDAMAAVVEAETEPTLVLHLLRHPAFPKELQARLAGSPLSKVRTAMARQTQEASLLERLAGDVALSVVVAVAASAFTSPAVLERLAAHPDKPVREGVACNPHTPLDSLEKLAATSDTNMAMIMANSPRLTEAIFKKLWPSPHVMGRVVVNEHAPESVLVQASERVRNSHDAYLKVSVAASPRCPVQELEHYARDPVFQVRAAVANNPKTPAALLAALATDVHASVRALAAKNPNCPRESPPRP